MERNSRKFGTPGITTVMGDFLETELGGLPAPDAVFIGGHGGKMIEILQKIKEVLLPDGVIVFNSGFGREQGPVHKRYNANQQEGNTVYPYCCGCL